MHVGQLADLIDLPDMIDQIKGESIKGSDTRHEMADYEDQSSYMDKIHILENQFMAFILLGNLALLKQSVAAMSQTIATYPMDQATMEALTLVLAFQQIIRKQFVASLPQFDVGSTMEKLHQIQSTAEVCRWLSEWSVIFFAEVSQWTERKNENIIERAIRYIEKSYAEKCTLLDVASHVHLNHKYFGLLFKRGTGETFVNYITKVRLEKAEILLNNTDMKVTEIAMAAGYDDPNYFTTVFRKKYNLSPN